MKKGKLYGVGVGPGDRELLTLKAVRILKESDVIAVPITKNGERTAYNIAKDYIEGKDILECNMVMTKDKDVLNKTYEAVAKSIAELLEGGKVVSFITLGDPTVYSTYMYINRLIRTMGYDVEIISGITSFCAVAARLNESLCERSEPLIILPASYKDIENALEYKGNKVFMKSGSKIGDVIDYLEKENKLDNAKMIECCGMENEKIYEDLSKVDRSASYFSVIIVKE